MEGRATSSENRGILRALRIPGFYYESADPPKKGGASFYRRVGLAAGELETLEKPDCNLFFQRSFLSSIASDP